MKKSAKDFKASVYRRRNISSGFERTHGEKPVDFDVSPTIIRDFLRRFQRSRSSCELT